MTHKNCKAKVANAKRHLKSVQQIASELRSNPPSDISPEVFMDLDQTLNHAISGFETVGRYSNVRPK